MLSRAVQDTLEVLHRRDLGVVDEEVEMRVVVVLGVVDGSARTRRRR
jgi:hypothetical protein